MLLVALALAVSVVISGQMLLGRVDGRASAAIAHEGNKLRAFATAGVDPHTGRAFTGVDALLMAFLRNNLPEDDETFFSIVDRQPAHRSSREPPARLDTDPAVVRWAADAARPDSRTVTTSAGAAMVGVFPVRMEPDPRPAAVVVVEFLAPERAQAWWLIRLLALIDLAALLVAGLAAWLVAGRVLRPIRQVRQAAEHIGATDLTTRIDVAGNDDVAQLARTFNRMLDRLERAFTAQREFLNDAGHELRTPLTVLRGHLELMGDDPAEHARTVPLLLDEIDRMRRLIDDLVLLAQADRPDFLRPHAVELADVVVEVIAKASAIAPRQWRIDQVADDRIVADGQRLTQALMQLCANAAAHTEIGDTIAAGASVSGTRVRLWVRDTGSGVDPTEAQRIFQRAVRGHDARPEHGSGLGLAIVTSIAKAHGGVVLLDSAPGEGATFTLDLPLRADEKHTDAVAAGSALGPVDHAGDAEGA